MTQLLRTSLLLATLALSGCATIGTLAEPETRNKVYSGTIRDVELECAHATCLDLPFSLVADTVVLPATIPWSIYNASHEPVSERDAKILDAVIGDALTNKELALEIEFYGGASNRTVRFTGFPARYKPTLAGYDFVPLPSEWSGGGLKLTLLLGGLWVDRAPPKDKFHFLHDAPVKGVLLVIYNSGDGTIGECFVEYEVEEIAGDWKVRYAGFFDP